MASTKDVLDNHLKCFGEGDLKGILSDYAPGAVLFTSDGPLRGADAIRPLFQAMIAEFGKPGATFSMKQQSIEGDYAYILWTAETADNVYEMATDTFVVRMARSWPSHSPARLRPRAENKPSFREAAQQADQADGLRRQLIGRAWGQGKNKT